MGVAQPSFFLIGLEALAEVPQPLPAEGQLAEAFFQPADEIQVKLHAGMGDGLGYYHGFSTDFPSGFGFTGIAVALLGRNRPVGIAFGALLFAYLDRSAQILDLDSIPREIVVIMQGIILLSVVIAYEVVQRIAQTQETKAAAEATRRMDEADVPAEVGA